MVGRFGGTAVTLLVAFVLLAPVASAAEGSSVWPMSEHDAQRTSLTDSGIDVTDLRILHERYLPIWNPIIMTDGSILAERDLNFYTKVDQNYERTGDVFYYGAVSSENPYPFVAYGPACSGPDGLVYLSFINNTNFAIVCCDSNLSKLWAIEFNGSLLCPPTLINNDTVFIASVDIADLSNGTYRNVSGIWLSKVGAILERSMIAGPIALKNMPVVVSKDGSMFMLLPGTDNDTLIQMKNDRSKGWNVTIPKQDSDNGVNSLHIDAQGRIIVVRSGHVICFSSLGQQLWTYGSGIVSLAIGPDAIYTLNDNSFLAAIQNGSMVWTFQGSSVAPCTSNVFVTENGAVLFATMDHLYALDQTNGEVLSDVVLLGSDAPIPISGNQRAIVPLQNGDVLVLLNYFGGNDQIVGGPQNTSWYQFQSMMTLLGIMTIVISMIVIAYRIRKYWTIAGDGTWMQKMPLLPYLMGRGYEVRILGFLMVLFSLGMAWFFYPGTSPGFFIDSYGYPLIQRSLTASSLISLIGAWALLLFLLTTIEYWWGGLVVFVSIMLISADISMFWSPSWLPFVNDMRNGLEFGWGFTVAILGCALVILSGFIPKKELEW